MMLRPAPDEKGLGLASCVLGCRGVAAIAHDAPRQMAASYLSNTLAEQTGEPGLQSGEASRNVYYLFLLRQLKLAARQVQESAFIPAWSGSSTRKAQAHSCPVRKLPVAGGRGVQYRKRHSLVQNIVVVWRKDKREPWFLTTDLNQGANQLCDLYGNRMQIEELFRDYKNRRNGFSLPCTRIRSPENLSRALRFWPWVTFCCWELGSMPRSTTLLPVGAARPGRTVVATSSSGSGCWTGSNSK